MVNFIVVSLVIVIISLISFGNILEAKELSKLEDLELERELRAINKPAVKIIKTEYGDKFGCVDIYKQPALDHPLLKNHKVQMRPSMKLLRTLRANSKKSMAIANSSKLELQESCPKGTVPIRRTTKEELKRAKSSFSRHAFLGFNPGEKTSDEGYEFGGLLMNIGSGIKYHGVSAKMSIYQPTVQPKQLSASVILLFSGYAGERSAIRTGWMVNPDVYGDTRTRFFSSWTNEHGGAVTGCFDVFCPGFVVTDSGIAPGLPYGNISTVGGPTFDTKLTISQDPLSGDWWLNLNEDRRIGYWPKTLFNYLATGADWATTAGAVKSNLPNFSPPMGSGVYDKNDYTKTSYMVQVGVNKDRDAKFTSPEGSTVRVLTSRCYAAGENFDAGGVLQYRFFFGGPGGSSEVCK